MRSTRASAAWAGLSLATSVIGLAISLQPQTRTLPDRPLVVEFHSLPTPLPSASSPITAGVFEVAVASRFE